MESSSLSNVRLLDLFQRVPDDELKELYERHGVSNRQDLVDEIRRDGSNTIVTWLWRWGEGVNYDEIVIDVANKLGVKYKPEEITDETQLELKIVAHLVKECFDSMSSEERAKFKENLDKLGKKFQYFWKVFFESTGTGVIILVLIEKFGHTFVQKFLYEVMKRLVTVKGGTVIATRLSGLVIPFLNITLVWILIDIAGPAYRKTVPTVFQIALMRLEYAE